MRAGLVLYLYIVPESEDVVVFLQLDLASQSVEILVADIEPVDLGIDQDMVYILVVVLVGFVDPEIRRKEVVLVD
jgi:hypothetical protein